MEVRMTKKYFVWILLYTFSASFAGSVAHDRALSVAQNFFQNRTLAPFENLQVQSIEAVPYHDRTAYYIVNFEPQGWVLVSGIDAHYPILAYSDEGAYSLERMPPAAADWMKDVSRTIYHLDQKGAQASYELQQIWSSFEQDALLNKPCGCTSVKPLLKTKWDQGEPYNWSCPYDDGYAVTGCVATALGQIMKYWNHPVKAEGHVSYYCTGFGTLSRTFDEKYAWAGMPATLTEDTILGEIFAVAHLLRDIGYAAEMEYGLDGSSASTLNAIRACINHFRYAADMSCHSKDKYNYSDWIALLKKELDAERPIYYQGYNKAETKGHAFVLDGYGTCDGYTCFHINWGWNGDDDGYYYMSDLEFSDHDYTYSQGAVIGIKPVYGNNDTPAKADFIRLPYYVSSSINPSYDLDWYVFYASDGMTLEIHTESVSGSTLDPHLYFYGPYSSSRSFVDSGDYIAYSNNSYDGQTNARIKQKITETGYYFLRVAQSEIGVWKKENTLAKTSMNDPRTGEYKLYIENYQPSTSMWEDFEDDFLPPLWDLYTTNTHYTWKQGNFTEHPFSEIDKESKLSAYCMWDDQVKQDEELDSHPFSLGHGTGYVSFYAFHNPYYLDYYSLTLFLRVRGEWRVIWQAGKEDGKKGWRFYQIDLSAYEGLSDLKLSWQYNGLNGDAVAIDNVRVRRDKVTSVEQIIAKTPPLPKDFALESIYPNPFNPATKIQFSVPTAAQIRLAVYDIMGRQVELLREKQYEPGIYQIQWNASGLPSGTYFIRLESGGFMQAKRCMLVR